MPAPSPLADRLTAKLVRDAGGCLLWTGSTDKWGYGRIWSGAPSGKMLTAHRVSLALSGVPVPDDALVLHGPCDNPSCCEPSHLRVGTHADNMADRRARERHAAKLTHEQVDALRGEHALGSSGVALAAKYGVSQSHVSRLVRGLRRGTMG